MLICLRPEKSASKFINIDFMKNTKVELSLEDLKKILSTKPPKKTKMDCENCQLAMLASCDEKQLKKIRRGLHGN